MARRGQRAWPRLNALPLDVWLQQLFESLFFSGVVSLPRLLSERQSLLWWRQIIERDDGSLEARGLAAVAAQARQQVLRWCLAPAQWQQDERLEVQSFVRWHAQYQARLLREQALDRAGLSAWIVEQGAVLRETLPRQVFLHGFNDPDEPQLCRLRQWMQDGGIAVCFTGPPARPGTCAVARFPQVPLQFSSALQWALGQRAPGRRIGIVLPDLQARRAQVRQWCQALWAQQPEAADQHWSDHLNISAGQPLTEYPLVSHLLLLLRGLEGELPLDEWARVLGSPCFPLDENEWLRRDAFVQWLRQKNLHRLSLARLEQRWQQFAPDGDFTARWLARVQSARGRLRAQPLSRWLAWMPVLLREVGWCQGRPLDSEEFQVRQRTQESLLALAELEEWLGPVRFDVFLREWSDGLRAQPFQPQTETAGIQILGVLEAAGLSFDALWLCGCEAVNWPEPLNPNPLLPRRVQRQQHLPGASPERELAYAKRLLEGFCSRSPEVICSWGERDGDTEHRLSSLLQHLPSVPAGFYAGCAHQWLEQHQFARWRQQVVSGPADVQGVPLVPGPVAGGSAVLRAQSQCPFRAYAEFRLQLKARDDLVDGVKPVDRGSLLHRVLEQFWRTVADSAVLQTLLADEVQLDERLAQILDQQLPLFRQRVVLEPEALYDLERERTRQVVKRWLTEAEAGRLPFQVAQVEKRKTLTIGGLELALTVDRIDQLEGGSQIIIDYKAGDRDEKAWQGERPDEPQLPLYALLEPEQTRGILFGVLMPDKLGYTGLLEEGQPFAQPCPKPVQACADWPAQVQQWGAVLTGLAEDFTQGQAAVDPRKPAVCDHCHLTAVCRIREVAHDAD